MSRSRKDGKGGHAKPWWVDFGWTARRLYPGHPTLCDRPRSAGHRLARRVSAAEIRATCHEYGLACPGEVR